MRLFPSPTYFQTVVWILVVMAGTPVVVLDNHVTLEMHTTQALAGPPPALFQWEIKINCLSWLSSQICWIYEEIGIFEHFFEI